MRRSRHLSTLGRGRGLALNRGAFMCVWGRTIQKKDGSVYAMGRLIVRARADFEGTARVVVLDGADVPRGHGQLRVRGLRTEL